MSINWTVSAVRIRYKRTPVPLDAADLWKAARFDPPMFDVTVAVPEQQRRRTVVLGPTSISLLETPGQVEWAWTLHHSTELAASPFPPPTPPWIEVWRDFRTSIQAAFEKETSVTHAMVGVALAHEYLGEDFAGFVRQHVDVPASVFANGDTELIVQRRRHMKVLDGAVHAAVLQKWSDIHRNLPSPTLVAGKTVTDVRGIGVLLESSTSALSVMNLSGDALGRCIDELAEPVLVVADAGRML